MSKKNRPGSEKNRPGRDDLPDLRWRLRPGFLVSFSLAGLLAVGLLAFAVSRIVGGEIRTEQLASAQRSAALLSASSFGPQLTRAPGRLGLAQLVALDHATLAARRTAGFLGVVIWSARSRILYSTDHRLIGTTVLRSPDVLAAFAGQPTTTVRSGARSPIGHFPGQEIDVAVPIYARSSTKPIAVAEIILPYAPVAQDVSRQTQNLDLILIGAALLFYAALWPRLLRASKAMRSQSDPRRKAMLRELSHAIKHEELLLHYQPTIDLAQAQVVAVEALVRWQHPKRGLLAPSEFLDSVDDDALNSELTLHVVAIALRDCGAWRDRGIDAGVNINLSVANVLDKGLPEQIGKLLATHGIPPGALALEVTEKAIVADLERATAMLEALHRMGVRIAIDDFGTGYSSLACLRDLPISELKVDREFVVGVHERPRDEAIVRGTIRLAHELDVKVIAEGVEDAETMDDLAGLECDMAQGYFFSRPLAVAQLIEWFETPVIAGRVTEQPAGAHQ